MSYTREQFNKHKEMIDNNMQGCTSEVKQDLYRFANCNWPDDAEMMKAIEDKKKVISLEASPEEIDSLFKYTRI